MTVTAQLSVPSTVEVTVPFTVTGTAKNPADYTITASPLRIPAGQTSANITITIVDDTSSESNETIIVTMGTPVNATKGTPSVHTATITDDDNSTLASLVTDTGTLVPAFASGTVSYNEAVSAATSSITIRPTVAQSGATVTVNGVPVPSGQFSGAINLPNVGPNTIPNHPYRGHREERHDDKDLYAGDLQGRAHQRRPRFPCA